MKQHTGQGKYVLFISMAITLALFVFCACDDRPNPFFCWSFDCTVNGEEISLYHEEDRNYFFYSSPSPAAYLPGYDGKEVIIYEDRPADIDVDYSRLAFNLEIPNYDTWGDLFFFHIVGDGKGPFKEGVNYNSDDNIVIYHPALPGSIVKINQNHGFQTSLLSGSFTFKHKEIRGVGKVLDFCFDFEEEIVAVPEGCDSGPLVGDTVRVSNGHFIQAPVYTELYTEELIGFIQKVFD